MQTTFLTFLSMQAAVVNTSGPLRRFCQELEISLQTIRDRSS